MHIAAWWNHIPGFSLNIFSLEFMSAICALIELLSMDSKQFVQNGTWDISLLLLLANLAFFLNVKITHAILSFETIILEIISIRSSFFFFAPLRLKPIKGFYQSTTFSIQTKNVWKSVLHKSLMNNPFKWSLTQRTCYSFAKMPIMKWKYSLQNLFNENLIK